jgi:hypothetical protein
LIHQVCLRKQCLYLRNDVSVFDDNCRQIARLIADLNYTGCSVSAFQVISWAIIQKSGVSSLSQNSGKATRQIVVLRLAQFT